MARSAVNDAARENMAGIARWYSDQDGSLTSTGTGAAYILTTNSTHAALADQSTLVFLAHAANSAAPTLNVDTLGAKTITSPGGDALPANTILANQIVVVVYDSTNDWYALVSASDLGVSRADDKSNAIGGSLALTSSELTIATGSVTATRSHHTIDTETDAATDDLATIAVGSVADGALLIIRAENTARTVVVKHGTGNIFLGAGGDLSLDDDQKSVTLQRRGANWYETARDRGTVLQIVNVQDGEPATGITTLPYDNTIPQNTEGDEYMTLAITPRSVTSTLLIDVIFNGSLSASNTISVALFQDATAGALAAVSNSIPSSITETISFRHKMTAGTTSATTFKVRAGPNAALTLSFNAQLGARRFGGVMASSITITEIAA